MKDLLSNILGVTVKEFEEEYRISKIELNEVGDRLDFLSYLTNEINRQFERYLQQRIDALNIALEKKIS